MACLGDSLSFGLGAAPAEAYPPRLEVALRQLGVAWSVVNAGIPGQSSADGVSRLPALLATYRPEVLCLLVGSGGARPSRKHGCRSSVRGTSAVRRC